MKTHTIAAFVHGYFHDYLGGTRGLSDNTQITYRDGLKLFFCYVSEELGKSIDELMIEDLDTQIVLHFLDHLEKERHNCVKTRNLRLAAIRSFMGYVTTRAPESIDVCKRVRAIAQKRTVDKLMPYLDQPESKAFLQTVADSQSVTAARDKACLNLFYDTGARVQEVVDLKLGDLHLTGIAKVNIMGKGRKQRACPLLPQTVKLLHEYLRTRPAATHEQALFLNQRGEPITRHGIAYMVKKHAHLASKETPSIVEKSVTPHTLRHTAAMRFLRAKLPESTIRDFLGHSDLRTTQRYARLDLEMKREALTQVQQPDVHFSPEGEKRWQNSKVLEFLDNLTKGGTQKPQGL